MSDRERAAVYAAEDQWSAVLDRGGRIDFFGSRLVLPVQLRFGDLAAMQAYIDARCAAAPALGPVRVRPRRGQARAHYADGVIAIPMETGWACRESVLLHELAHHVARATQPAHGTAFRRAMLDLVLEVQGAESALVLRTCYESNGLAHVA